MPALISMLLCLVIALVIGGAVLYVVRAALAIQGNALAPFAGLIYALIVLIVVLMVVYYCIGFPPVVRH